MKREKRKINKFKIGIIVFIFLIILLSSSGMGRFIYTLIRDNYLTSRNFYFTSNLLTSDDAEYTYQNWDGTGLYDFEIELYSKLNELQKLEENLDYTVMVKFPEKLNCAINTTKFKEPNLLDHKRRAFG